MTAAGASSTQTTPEDFTRTLRYKIGLFMFIVGNLGIPVAAVPGFVGFSAAILGAIVVGAEIILWTSVVVLGRTDKSAFPPKCKANANFTDHIEDLGPDSCDNY